MPGGKTRAASRRSGLCLAVILWTIRGGWTKETIGRNALEGDGVDIAAASMLDKIQADMDAVIANRLAKEGASSSAATCQQCLYPAFESLRRLSEQFDHCRTVVYTVALYPAVDRKGQRFGHAAQSQDDPGKYAVDFPNGVGGHLQRGRSICNVALVTASTVVAQGATDGWTFVDIDGAVPFPDDLTRSAKTLRLIPFLLFPKAQRIFYGDTKCAIRRFHKHAYDESFTGASLVTLKHHRRFNNTGNIMQEFKQAFNVVKSRRSPLQDLVDIRAQITKYRSEGFITETRRVPLPDVMCLYFAKRIEVMRNLLCHWNCEIVHSSIRVQLSFNYALERARMTEPGDVAFLEHVIGTRGVPPGALKNLQLSR